VVVRLQVRHDTKANWEFHNPLLSVGEIGIEIDNEVTPNRMKIGNGTDRWDNLPFYDEAFIHASEVDEDILGEKTFKNPITMDCNLIITEGHSINGQIERAEQDSIGNIISDYYQRRLAFSNYLVNENVDWNELLAEGTYSVDATEVGFSVLNHTPYDLSPNMCSSGILTVARACNNRLVQIYTPISFVGQSENTIMSVVYRTDDAVIQDDTVYHNWSSWTTYTASDTSIVHTTGNEIIRGSKTFENSLSVLGDTLTLGNVESPTLYIKKNENVLIEDNSADALYIATNSANIKLRPNGRNNTTGEVTIDSAGIINGKITKDSEGNTITNTYVKKEDLATSTRPIVVRDVELLSADDFPIEFESILDRKIESFDIHTLTVNGTPIIEEDGIITGFSTSNYLSLATIIDTTKPWTIKMDITTANLGVQQGIFMLSQYFYLTFSTDKSLQLRTTDNNMANWVGTDSALADDTNYYIECGYDGTKIFLNCQAENGELIESSKTPSSYSGVSNLSLQSIGNYTTYPFKGSINFKSFAIEVDGEEIFNTHRKQIDIIKADNYGMSGSPLPTISSDGVASGFSATGRITAVNLSVNNNFEISFNIKTGTNSAEYQTILRAYGTSESQHLFTIGLNYGKLLFSTDSITRNTVSLQENTEYTIVLDISGTNYSVRLDEDEAYNGSIDTASFSTINLSLGSSGSDNPFTGSIDLNTLQVIRNEVVVYQPCLRIPYVYSRHGVKIVDMKYKDRVNDCYEQFRTGNYFVIDEENGLFQMPHDTLDGSVRTIASYRNGKVSYEYNTDLECIQTGACTSGTRYTFPKPFADNNYVLPVACSSRDKDGFTPSSTTDFIAKGRITLG